MKKMLTITMLFFVLAVAGCGEVRREPISLKEQRGHLTYVFGEKSGYDGILFDLYESGQLKVELPFQDGKLNGVAKAWHANGQLAEEVTFEHGEHTEKVTYNENGQLMEEGTSKDSQVVYCAEAWYERGQLKPLKYENGRLTEMDGQLIK